MDGDLQETRHPYYLWCPLRCPDGDDEPLKFPNDYGIAATVGRPGMTEQGEGVVSAFHMFNDAGHGVAVDDYITAPDGKNYRFTGASLVYLEEHAIGSRKTLATNMDLVEAKTTGAQSATTESIRNVVSAWRQMRETGAPDTISAEAPSLGWAEKVKASQRHHQGSSLPATTRKVQDSRDNGHEL